MSDYALWACVIAGGITLVAVAVMLALLLWWPIAVIGGKVFHYLPRGKYYAWRAVGFRGRLRLFGLGIRIGNGFFGYLRHESKTIGKPDEESA